jgi:hypothetical protein
MPVKSKFKPKATKKKSARSKKLGKALQQDVVDAAQEGLSESAVREELTNAMKDVTLETLPKFIDQALTRPHDYGTICVAIGAIAAAAAKAADRSPGGGITGFQAGAVFWEFQKQWGVFGHGEKPLRMLQYNNMLYPQYAHDFKSISSETWEWLQKRATELLNEKRGPIAPTDAVVTHWRSIKAGIVPFGFTVERD